MMTVAPAPHEYAAHYLFEHGLGPYFAASRQVDRGNGAMRGTFERDGETWNVVLSFQVGGLAPPESGTTPDGTDIEFEAPLREFRLNATVDDDVGEKKVKTLLQPRWKGLQSEDGNDVARPVWEVGDATNARVNAANVEFDDILGVIADAADAVGIDGRHFEPDHVHRYSTVIDAARYVRIDREESGPIHARDGPLARLGHLLENDRSGYRKVVQDDTEVAGYYHTATLGSKRVREAWGEEHRLPRECKHYYPRSPSSFSASDALAHPKLEAAYERGRWESTIHPLDDLDDLRDELDESVLSVLHEAGLPVRVDGSTKPTGSSVFVEDAYFQADEADRGTVAVPLELEQIETGQTNIVIKHLRDGLSPVEWDSLDMLVSDGGETSPDDIADEKGWHPDSVRKALRRIDSLVERSYGEVSLRSHHIAELVHDAVVEAEEHVRRAVESGAKALELVDGGIERAEEELVAWASTHGIHVSERDAEVVVRMGDIADEPMSFRQMCQRLLELWKDAGRDAARLKASRVEYRERGTPKIRPFSASNRSGFGVGGG